MKFKYSKFQGFDVFSINLGELMDSMSDALLDSGYDDDYYWTRQQKQTDTSLDALRRALLQALEMAEAGPTISIRVQELFGVNKHPSIAGGRVPLVIALLSPAHRPVQRSVGSCRRTAHPDRDKALPWHPNP